MKNLYSINRIIAIGLLLTTWGCEPEFVPDPIDPRLPIYSEKGSNVAGAFINGEPWINRDWHSFYGNTQSPQFQLFADHDSLVIEFYGHTNENISLEFSLKGLNINDFNDLKKLEGQKIIFNGNQHIARFIPDTASFYQYTYNPYQHLNSGQIYFRKIDLIWDQQLSVFAGTFGFNFTTPNGKTIEITYGRFDFSVNRADQFYEEND